MARCRDFGDEALLRSAASLQGLTPSAGWGFTSGFRRLRKTLALLGFASLGRSPSRASGLSPIRVALSARASRRVGRPGTFRPQATVTTTASSSQALQERTRTGYCSLCFRVSKIREVGFTSSEAAGP